MNNRNSHDHFGCYLESIHLDAYTYATVERMWSRGKVEYQAPRIQIRIVKWICHIPYQIAPIYQAHGCSKECTVSFGLYGNIDVQRILNERDAQTTYIWRRIPCNVFCLCGRFWKKQGSKCLRGGILAYLAIDRARLAQNPRAQPPRTEVMHRAKAFRICVAPGRRAYFDAPRRAWMRALAFC